MDLRRTTAYTFQRMRRKNKEHTNTHTHTAQTHTKYTTEENGEECVRNAC